MKNNEYSIMAERESGYWWHVGRLKIIETYLNKATKGREGLKILNVGSGTGGTIETLEKYGQVDNVDISSAAIKFAKQRGFKRMIKANGIKIPYKTGAYDLVVAFDVLEHIEEDEEALKEWHRLINNDGHILLTVPAYQWLWSGHDISLRHKRRYTKATLSKVATRANLSIVKMSYAIVFSLPLIVGFRFLNKLINKQEDDETSYVNVPGWVNSVFIQFLAAEARMHNYINFPAGTSVITILKKSNKIT